MPTQIFSAPPPVARPVRPTGPEGRPMVHASTMIETEAGPRAVETLKAGDRVVTASGEAAALESVARLVLPRADWAYAPGTWPLRVPVGVLGNTCPMRLSPGMRVALPGDAGFVTMADLVGIGGVTRDRPLADIRYFELRLADHALIRAEGALCETAPVGPRLVREPLDREAARRAFGRLTGQPGA